MYFGLTNFTFFHFQFFRGSIMVYYKILGIEASATDSEIGEAYRKLAGLYHPRNGNPNPESRELFRKVSEAYDVLSDPVYRSIHDNKLTSVEDFIPKHLRDPLVVFDEFNKSARVEEQKQQMLLESSSLPKLHFPSPKILPSYVSYTKTCDFDSSIEIFRCSDCCR